MMPSKQPPLLNALSARFPIIESAALMTQTGLMLEDTFQTSIAKDNLAAISSGLKHQAAHTLHLANCGQLYQVEMLCTGGNIIITQVFEGVLLVIQIDPKNRCQLDIDATIDFLLNHQHVDETDETHLPANDATHNFRLCVN